MFVYHISLVKVQTNYCNNNIPLTLDVKQLNKTIKLYYFHNLKALWDGKSKTKMYYGIFRIKKQLSGKKSVAFTVASTKALSKHLTLNVLIPDKVKKLSKIFIFTLLCGASKKCENKNFT